MSKPSHQPPGPRSGRIASMQALGAAASGVRWGWLIAALLLALLATALASLQSLNPHPLLPATPWERLRYPWELNAPERLPLVPSRLTSISVIPAQASDCELSGAGPSAPPRIWAVGGAGAIVHSPDGGITWEPRNSHVDQGLAAVHFDCKGLVGQAVGDGGTLLVTQDGGALWTQARVDGAKLQDDLWAMTFPIPTQPDIGWAGGAGGVILKTTDAGLSWQRQRSGTARQIESLTFDPDGQRGWAMLGNGELLGTADGGAHWVTVAAVSGISPTEIRVVPDSGQVWMVGRLEPTPVKPGAPADAAQPVAALARIEPGAAAPVAATTPAMVGGSASGREGGVPRLTSLHIGSHGEQAWAIGASGQVITSTDSGAHWQAQASGVTDRLIALTFWDDNAHGWALGMDGIIIATTNGGRSWTTLTHGDQHSLNDVWFTPDAQRGWAVGPGGRILASTDRGRTWHTQDSGVSTGLNRVRFLPDGLHGWIAGNAGTLLRSVDGGLSWQARRDSADAPSGRAAPADLHGLAFQRDGLKGWAVGDRATWLTTDDGGQRWYAEGALPLGGAPCSGEATPNPHLNDIAFSADGQTGWIVGRDQTVLVSQDAGQRWRRLCAGSTASGAPAYPNAAAPAPATLRALHVVEPPANDETGASALAWAVGGDGTVLRIGSDAIEAPMKLAPDDELRAVRFNAAGTTGWAVGDKGVIAIWQAASGRKTRAGWSYEATDLPGDWRGLWTSANADSMWFAGVSPGLVSRDRPGPGASPTGGAKTASGTDLGASGGGWWVPAWPQRHRVYPAPWYALALLLSGAMVWWAFRVRAPRRDEGINAMSATDAPTATFDEDRLAFGPLARGISRYLRNEKTQPPLTLAVQGDWGVGKSSLMSLLCTDLRRYGYRPVWFNAWHHQSDEQMLAGLLAAIQRQGVPPWLGIEGLAFRLRLVWARGRQYLIASLLLLWLLALAAGYVHGHSEVETTQLLDLVGGWLKAIAALFDGKAPPPDTNQLVKPLVPLGGLLFMGSMVYRYLNLFGVKPGVLVSQAARQLSAKDAEAAAGFRARFATQFAQVADSLRPQRLVIVIDDLDRCRPEAVLSVMESVNFLVSSGKCFVVFGMSKPIVEASLSLSFEKVAKELAVMEDATDAAGAPLSDEERRRRFVRRYLEKLVNVEISVPERRDLPAYALLAPDEAAPTPAWHWRALRTALPVLLVVFVAGLGWNLGHVADGRLLVTSTTARQIATSSAPAKSVSARTRPNTVVGELVSRLPGSPVQTESADLDPMGWLVFALPLALLVLGSLAYAVLTLRTARIVVQDSAPFQAALRIWSPLAHQRLPTPRAIKRFGNRIRYLAMLHQAETMDHSRLDALPAWLAASLRAVLQPGSRPKATATTATTAATPGTGTEAAPPVRNEPMVVALGALHEVYGAGWRARLQASVDDPAGFESLLDQTLAEAIRLHRDELQAPWPPTEADLAAFERTLRGVRLAGDPTLAKAAAAAAAPTAVTATAAASATPPATSTIDVSAAAPAAPQSPSSLSPG